MTPRQVEWEYDDSPVATGSASGFYLAGGTPFDWLALLTRNAEAAALFSDWRYYLLPATEVGNATAPQGIVALPPIIEAEESQRPSNGCHSVEHRDAARLSRHQPAGAVGLTRSARHNEAELWVPVSATTRPQLTADQLAAQLPPKQIMVWTLATGLVGFEPEDRHSIHQLVAVPKNGNAARWVAPPQSVRLPNRINRFELLERPTDASLFGSEAESIGADSDRLNELNNDSLSARVQNQLRDWAERVAERFSEARSKPSEGSASNSNAKSQSWLSQKLLNGLQAKRDREIDKLVEMLDRDPDQALRYALPLSGEGGYRGLATPGDRLTKHGTDFSLSGLRGGGAADVWSLDASMRLQLEAAYRRQANRELSLGHARRAAYIHAHLLGDHHSAAMILEQAGFFAEAAELFRHRLNQPENAARCYAASGQYGVAAQLYIDRNDFLSAAEVWERAGDPDRARSMFENAVRQKLAAGNVLLAADLLLRRLNERTQAETLLRDQWPSGTHAVVAARTLFQWWGEAGEHAKAATFLQTIATDHSQAPLAIATVTSELSRNYPDAGLRGIAEDACRVAVATNLATAAPMEREQRLDKLTQMAVNDPMLARDVARYLERTAPPMPALPTESVKGSRLNKTGTVQLPAHKQWLSMEFHRGDWLAIGAEGFQLRLVRIAGLLENEPRRMEKDFQLGQPMTSEHRCAVQVVKTSDPTVASVYFVGPTAVHFRAEELASPDHGEAWWVTSPFAVSGVNANGCLAISTAGRLWALAETNDGLVLRELHPPQGSIRSYALTHPLQTYAMSPVMFRDGNPALQLENLHLACVGETPIAIVDRIVCRVQDGMAEAVHELPPVHAVCGSLPFTRRRVAIAHRQGITLCWLDLAGLRFQMITDDAAYQHVTFLHSAQIAAISDQVLRVFQIRNDHVRVVAETLLDTSPLFGLRTVGTHALAVCYENGRIDHYRLSGPQALHAAT